MYLYWGEEKKREKEEERGEKREKSVQDMAEVRLLKRRAGIAEETVRIKRERLEEAEQEEHQRRLPAFRRAWRRSGSSASRCWLDWHVMQV